MALISIILGLLLDRTFRHLHDLRDMAWFEVYTQAIQRYTNKVSSSVIPPLQFILIIAPPVLLTFWIQLQLYGFLFNLLGFIFGTAIFIYCLGPACLSSDVEAYKNARTAGDDDEALHYASSITGAVASTVPDQQIIDVTRAILYVANERIFSTIFWFALLGPFGAILYRLISELSKQDVTSDLSSFATFIHSFMAWIPARMLAAGYALTGNFDSAYHSYKTRNKTSELAQNNYDTLVSTGLGALHKTEIDDEIASVHAAESLVIRAVIVWIAILAVMTLGGVLN